MTRSETVRNVIEEFDLRRAADEREYDARLAELSEKIPGFGDITHALSSVGLRILDAAMKGGDTASAVAEVRRETEKLRAERCDLLEKAGYPRDFADRRYRCEKSSSRGSRIPGSEDLRIRRASIPFPKNTTRERIFSRCAATPLSFDRLPKIFQRIRPTIFF